MSRTLEAALIFLAIAFGCWALVAIASDILTILKTLREVQ
jgi:hypothetical protein